MDNLLFCVYVVHLLMLLLLLTNGSCVEILSCYNELCKCLALM